LRLGVGFTGEPCGNADFGFTGAGLAGTIINAPIAPPLSSAAFGQAESAPAESRPTQSGAAESPTDAEPAGVAEWAIALAAAPAEKRAPDDYRLVERQIVNLHTQIESLSDEIGVLRRRDESLNFYMVRLDEELRLAARLQQDFLPKTLPRVGPVQFHTLWRPAGYVSGDIYDVARLDETHVGFYMADAVGHGMPAALLTMFIKNAMVTKQIIPGGYRLLSPAETLRGLNKSMVEQNLTQGTFATGMYGVIDCKTLRLTLARAGHPTPLLLTPGRELREIESEGGLLGIFPDEDFEEVSLQLSPGDRLVIHSDGVEVAFSDQPALDPAKWRELVQSRSTLDGETLLAELGGLLDGSSGSITPKDDLTIILLEVK
jgi:serine phosphatase RsbU (regulator of sigma subunit)